MYHTEVLPFRDKFEIKLLSGRDLVQLLEISVSEDTPEGKFLQISGASFDANKNLPVGQRVSNVSLVSFPRMPHLKPMDNHSDQIPCAGVRTPIQPDALYTAVVSSFLAQGYDGYSLLKETLSVRSYHQTEKITHSELVMRMFGYSLGRDRQPQEASGLSNSLSSPTNKYFTGAEHSPEVFCGELGSDTKACRSLSSRNLIWEKRALKRARQSLVIGHCDKTGLPIISPTVDGRINLLKKYD